MRQKKIRSTALKVIENINDNVGTKINWLTIVSVGPNLYNDSIGVICKCDCGVVKNIRASCLFKNKVYSCGCYNKIKTKSYIGKRNNKSRSDEYHIYYAMIKRCYKSYHKEYKNYGARGISICDRWLNKKDGFNNFLLDMGDRPSKNYSIERIDVNGNYELSNCRWATQKEQLNNKRNNVIIEYNGVKKTATQWAEYFSLKPAMVISRVNLGWPVEKLFIPSTRIYKNKETYKIEIDEKTNNIDSNNSSITEL